MLFNLIATNNETAIGVLTILFIVLSVIIGVLALVAGVIQFFLYFRYHRANRVRNHLGKNGGEVARILLDNIGLSDVDVKKAGIFRALLWGNSYSARKKTVFLRRGIINKQSLTATAVAAQKVGVAQLDANKNPIFKSRYFLGFVNFFGSTFIPLFLILGIGADYLAFSNLGVFSVIAAVISLAIVVASAAFTYVQIPIEKAGVEFAREKFREFDMLDEEEDKIVEKYYKAYILDFKIAFLIRILEIIRAILRIIIAILKAKAENN